MKRRQPKGLNEGRDEPMTVQRRDCSGPDAEEVMRSAQHGGETPGVIASLAASDAAGCGGQDPGSPAGEAPRKCDESSARQRLIRAMANPLEVRLDAELVQDLGVSEELVRTWLEEREFQEAVDAELIKRRGDARASVWRALIREALRGSFQHIKLYLELTGDLQPRTNGAEETASPVVIIRSGN